MKLTAKRIGKTGLLFLKFETIHLKVYKKKQKAVYQTAFQNMTKVFSLGAPSSIRLPETKHERGGPRVDEIAV